MTGGRQSTQRHKEKQRVIKIKRRARAEDRRVQERDLGRDTGVALQGVFGKDRERICVYGQFLT